MLDESSLIRSRRLMFNPKIAAAQHPSYAELSYGSRHKQFFAKPLNLSVLMRQKRNEYSQNSSEVMQIMDEIRTFEKQLRSLATVRLNPSHSQALVPSEPASPMKPLHEASLLNSDIIQHPLRQALNNTNVPKKEPGLKVKIDKSRHRRY